MKLRIIVCIILLINLCGCQSDMVNGCENRLLEKVELNSQELIAYKFERNCGITTAFSYHLSIMDNDKKFNNKYPGNIFRSKSDFILQLDDENTLRVKYSKTSSVFKEETEFEKINIIYEKY